MSTQYKTREKSKMIYAKLVVKIILTIILITISVFFIKSSLSANSALAYTETGNIDYKVYLKENDFYKYRYLGKNMTYITSLVDYIDIDFNYIFDTSEKSNMNYTYSVFANLVITPEDNSKVLFDETYILKEDVFKEFSGVDEYSIAKTITLDYNYYNDLANMFKSTYGVNCNSKLIVGLAVDTNGKDLKYETEFNNSNELKIVFSLAKKQVDIDMTSATIDTTQNVEILAKGLIKNKGLLMMGIVFLVLTVLAIASVAKTMSKIRSQKDGYTRYIDKILNNYDRAIVETQYIPNLDDYEVIKINKFSELLDVRDTLRLPIIYSPVEEKSSCFYIRHGDTIYIHYVESTSLVAVKKFDSLFM